MKNLLPIALLSLFLWSCNDAKKTDAEKEMMEHEHEMEQSSDLDAVNIEQDVIDHHTSKTSLDIKGTYKGKTPCADCEAIETELTLKEDKSYVLRTKHVGKDDAYLEQVGMYTWSDDGSRIILGGVTNMPNTYMVGENRITQLDRSGNRVTGSNADKYILRK